MIDQPDLVLAALAAAKDSRRALPQPDRLYYLIEVPDGEWPVVRGFADVRDLVLRLAELVGRDVSVFPFVGRQLAVTSGPAATFYDPASTVGYRIPPPGTPRHQVRPIRVLPARLIASDGWLGVLPDGPVEVVPVDRSPRAMTGGRSPTTPVDDLPPDDPPYDDGYRDGDDPDPV